MALERQSTRLANQVLCNSDVLPALLSIPAFLDTSERTLGRRGVSCVLLGA